MDDSKDPNIIEASPTKEFFIFMLTKDILLIRAIADLVDNSVDGANRLKGFTDTDRFNDLYVRIKFDKYIFEISDNCGGIKSDLARKYAFKFGRDPEAPDTPHSIGQFGVGMKRALFKLGNLFKIESRTQDSYFVVEEDVTKWAQERNNWDFKFKILDEKTQNSSSNEFGTTISVSELHESVAEEFQLDNFYNKVVYELKAAHQISLDKGLSISVNGLPLSIEPLSLLSSEELQPAYEEKSIEVGNSQVNVKFYTGIEKAEPSRAGWYVFCNGRLILDSDRSFITGWGDGLPQYHNQFAKFRGYVFFDSDNARLLPWNTTKSGVDYDSTIYKSMRLEMIRLTRPVLTFLQNLDREKCDIDPSDSLSMESTLSKAKPMVLKAITQVRVFQAPVKITQVNVGPALGQISFKKTMKEISIAKKVLGVKSNREIGEKTFEYFYNLECED